MAGNSNRRFANSLGRAGVLAALFGAGLVLSAFPFSAAAAERSLTVSADTYSSAARPTETHGSRVTMKAESATLKRAYLRFDVGGLSGPPARATLRVFVVYGSGAGLEAYAVSNDWSESTLTFQNAPAPGARLSSAGSVAVGVWASFDVTSAITGNGPVSLVVGSSGGDFQLASRESGHPAVLVLDDGAGASTSSPGSTTSATTAPAPTTTSAPTTTTTTTTEPHHDPMPAANPTTCAGYPERRFFLESQAWWRQTPGRSGTDFGHVHSATCFPVGGTLSGVAHFDVRLMMHMNPGVLTKLRIQIFNSGAPDPVKVVPLNYRCAVETCTWWVPVDVDTRLANDGCQEFRFQAWVKEPDGKELIATNGWRVVLRNGNRLAPYCDARGVNFTEGRGWYTNFGYENGRLDDPFPAAPVSGIWSPKLKAGAGSEGITPTYHVITVDPNFHMGHKGLVLHEGPGSWSTNRLAIDTRKLANGVHRLLIRTDANTTSGSTLSGALVLPFTVQN